LLGGRAVALLLQSSEPDMVLLSGASEVEDMALLRRFRQALDAALPKYPTDVAFAAAADMLGADLASSLKWTDCTLIRLAGSSGELVGLLCLADRGAPPSSEDRLLLRAIA